MEMQYLMHLAHEVFNGSRMASWGHISMHRPHRAHFRESIAGSFSRKIIFSFFIYRFTREADLKHGHPGSSSSLTLPLYPKTYIILNIFIRS